MVREVAESCVDGVVMEMVAAYCGRFYAAKPELAARRIEAIGFQVGHQLSERYDQNLRVILPLAPPRLPYSSLGFPDLSLNLPSLSCGSC